MGGPDSLQVVMYCCGWLWVGCSWVWIVAHGELLWVVLHFSMHVAQIL